MLTVSTWMRVESRSRSRWLYYCACIWL